MQKELIISSSIENICKVENLVNDFNSKYQLGEDVYGNVLISLTEAVNNAIIHGNKNNIDKDVVISHKIINNKTLSITVKDQGDGFDYNNLPDPTAPENLTMVGGRGVFLIRQLPDYTIFSDKGESVELQFKL